MRAIAAAMILALVSAAPAAAQAFCGFYVGGADANLYNDATVVALMRDGTRAVLSMQNHRGCAGCASATGGGLSLGLIGVAFAAVVGRRRRR